MEFDPILWDAITNDDIEHLRNILQTHGHLIDTANFVQASERPLHLAAKTGRVAAIEELMAFGSQAIDVQDQWGKKPLYHAAENGHAAAIEALFRLGTIQLGCEDPMTPYRLQDSGRPLYIAIEKGYLEVVEELVRLGFQVNNSAQNSHGWPLLHCAARYGHAAIVEKLVQLGCSDSDSMQVLATPLFIAASEGRSEVIELLVRLGSKAIDTPAFDRLTPLFRAAERGHVSAIETLVRLGSQAIDTPDGRGWTPLYAAIYEHKPEVFEALVRLGSKAIDTPDKDGWMPMHRAAQRGQGDVVRRLIYLGSRALDLPYSQESFGRTPMYLAVQYATAYDGSGATLKVLKALGADLNFRLDGLSEEMIAILHSITVSEDEVRVVRHEAYFLQSLANRLLFELERPALPPQKKAVASQNIVLPTGGNAEVLRSKKEHCQVC